VAEGCWGATIERASSISAAGTRMVAGRELTWTDVYGLRPVAMVSENLARELWGSARAAIGKRVRSTEIGPWREVVGVVEDFNFTSLKQTVEPLVISPNPDRNVVLVRLKPGNLSKNIELVKNAYARVAPLYPCDYTFLDQKFDELYRNDLRQQNILSIFSGLAILIACLGLFGLTSFTVAKRTKEIGVRKVLGSSVQNIIVLLSKELLKPVLLATLIAIPVAYGVMHNWLQDFAYKINISWSIFVLAGVMAIFIAFVTVSFQAIKAAIANPVRTLRSE